MATAKAMLLSWCIRRRGRRGLTRGAKARLGVAAVMGLGGPFRDGPLARGRARCGRLDVPPPVPTVDVKGGEGRLGKPMALDLLLSSARNDRNLKQSQVADFVGVSQGTVSAWETGSQVPSEEHWPYLALVLLNGLGEAGRPQSLDEVEKRLSQLPATTRQAAKELRASIEKEAESARRRPRGPRVLSEKGYIGQQQAYLDAMGDDRLRHVSICFLGPQNLPVIDSRRVEDVWVRNLQRGVHYVVTWFLCLADEGVIKELAPRFKHIGERADSGGGRGCGTVRHIGVRLLNRERDSVYETNKADFLRCKDADFIGNEWTFLKSVDDGLTRQLLQHHVPHGSVVVYYSPEPGLPRLAGVSLRSTKNATDSKEQESFHFLGRIQTDELYKLTAQVLPLRDDKRAPSRKA